MALPPLLVKFNDLRQTAREEFDNAVEMNNAYACFLVKYSAQMVRLSTRMAEMSIGKGPEGGGGSAPEGSLGPEGYEQEGSQVAPVSIVSEGSQPPKNAAVSFIVE